MDLRTQCSLLCQALLYSIDATSSLDLHLVYRTDRRYLNNIRYERMESACAYKESIGYY